MFSDDSETPEEALEYQGWRLVNPTGNGSVKRIRTDTSGSWKLRFKTDGFESWENQAQ